MEVCATRLHVRRHPTPLLFLLFVFVFHCLVSCSVPLLPSPPLLSWAQDTLCMRESCVRKVCCSHLLSVNFRQAKKSIILERWKNNFIFEKNHCSRQDADFHDSQFCVDQVFHEATGSPLRALECHREDEEENVEEVGQPVFWGQRNSQIIPILEIVDFGVGDVVSLFRRNVLVPCSCRGRVFLIWHFFFASLWPRRCAAGPVSPSQLTLRTQDF